MTATSFINSNPSVIVIGAGPIGLYTAMALRTAGCRVCIIDNGRRGAGWASGGMLGAAYEVLGDDAMPPIFKTFARNSQKLWAEFLNIINAPKVVGSVFVARDSEEAARFGSLSTAARAFDVNVQARDVPEHIQGLQAWACASDVAFDPRHMLKVLRQHCATNGVAFIGGAASNIQNRQVTLLDGTTMAADYIIVATGPSGNSLSAWVPELESLSLVKGQMLSIAGSGLLLTHAIRAGRVYLIPRGDRIVVGATSVHGDTDGESLDAPAHHQLLQEATLLCPTLRLGKVVESWAGLRPMTPDALPLVGKSQAAGVILATGGYRNGWLLAPAIADSVKELVLGGPADSAILQLFAPNRFPTSPNRTNCPDN